MSGKNLSTVSLFSGCGGLDLGFVREGFDIIWANELLKDACDTYELNIGKHIVHNDILEIDLDEIPKADLVIGGPPCQGFSGIGLRKPDDERSELVWNFFDVIDKVQPRIFVFENVIGLKSARLPLLAEDGTPLLDKNGKAKKSGIKVIDELIEKFEDLGYDNLEVLVLNAANYGVPQRRRRVFIIGNKLGITFGSPVETHSETGSATTQKWVSSFDAISDFGPPVDGAPDEGIAMYSKAPDCEYQKLMRDKETKVKHHTVPYVSPSEKKIIPYIKQGGNYMDVPDEEATKRILGFKESGGRTTTYGRLHPEKPTYTINTHFNRINIGQNIHYAEDRIITLREGLRFQSFPDSYEIMSSTKRNYYLQIGNAVPPLLAQAIARMIKSKLD